MPFYCCNTVVNHMPDFVFAHAGDESGVVDAVAEQFPLQPDALVDDIGHVVAYGSIQGYAGADTEALELFHDAPYAGAIAVVTQRVVQNVRSEEHTSELQSIR